MYFVVPKGRSILKNVFRTESAYSANKYADKAHAEIGDHFDVIHMTTTYTTQTLGELLDQDMRGEVEPKGEPLV